MRPACTSPLGMADHERPLVTVAVRVGSAGGAVTRQAARYELDLGTPAHVQGPRAGYLDRLAPGAVALADHERLLAMGAVRVEPAGGAVARRGTRHRADEGTPALVQGPQAGHLDRLAPRAIPLADHEPLPVTGAVAVEPPGRAVARQTARDLADASTPARVQGPRAGYLDRLAPGAVALAGHERLPVTVAVRVATAGGAVARRGTRHRADEGTPALVQGPRAGHLDGF